MGKYYVSLLAIYNQFIKSNQYLQPKSFPTMACTTNNNNSWNKVKSIKTNWLVGPKSQLSRILTGKSEDGCLSCDCKAFSVQLGIVDVATGVWSTVDFVCRSLIKCLCVEVLLHSFSNAEQLEGGNSRKRRVKQWKSYSLANCNSQPRSVWCCSWSKIISSC